MNTPDKQNIINQIESVIRLNKTFTAFDITKLLRKRDFHINHNDVRKVVYEYILPDHYMKTMQLILGAPNGTEANIFHNIKDCAIDYNPNWVEEEGLTGSKPKDILFNCTPAMLKDPVYLDSYFSGNVTPTATPIIKSEKLSFNSDGSFKPVFKSRNRLIIPSKFVRKANFKEGDLVNISAVNDSIVITDYNSLRDSRAVRVGKNDIIRLRKSDFINAFGSVPTIAYLKTELLNYTTNSAITITKQLNIVNPHKSGPKTLLTGLFGH